MAEKAAESLCAFLCDSCWGVLYGNYREVVVSACRIRDGRSPPSGRYASPRRKPDPYERWYVANTIGKTGRKCHPLFLATRNAAPTDTATYSPANAAQAVTSAAVHHAEPSRLATAIPNSKARPASKHATGMRCRQEPGLPCLRITETFQKPY